jgi:hypothetical protein
VDYVEENQSDLFVWEFKWNIRAKARFPKTSVETYPQCRTAIVTPDNFESSGLLLLSNESKKSLPWFF